MPSLICQVRYCPYSGGEPRLLNGIPTPHILSVNAGSFVAGAGDVFRVGTIVGMGLRIGAALAAQFQHTVAESAQEAAIMGHEKHRPFEILESGYEHFL